MSIEQLTLFFVSAFLVIIAPGPDILFVLSQGMTHGKKAGFTTAAGLAAGNIVHTTAAALGIAALLAAYPRAFFVVKLAGIAYLLFLAWQTFRHRNDDAQTNNTQSDNLFFRGFIMNILNPKVAMFYLAFFPQFISAEAEHPVVQTLALGACFILMVLCVFGTVGVTSGYIGNMLTRHPRWKKVLTWANIFIFCMLAVKLAL